MDLNVPQVTAAPTEVVAPSNPAESTRPVAAADRIQTMDIIRGLALCGILLMNIPGFGYHWSNYQPLSRGPQNTADFITWEVVQVFFSGTMRGLFSMLFGAGMILFTLNKKSAPLGPSVTELYYRRLLLLVLFGVINAYVLLWGGDILYYYGIAGMVLYPFRKTSAKWLLILGLACIGVGMIKGKIGYNEMRTLRTEYLAAVKVEKEGKKLTPEQQQAKQQWLERENWKPDPQVVQRDVTKRRSDYLTLFSFSIPNNASNETWGGYHGIWDSLSMMFLGMALFSIGFFSNKLSSSTYLIGLLVGYGIGIPLGYFMFRAQVDYPTLGRYVDAFRWDHWTLYDVRRGLIAIGHASLLILVFRSRIIPGVMKGLANVGQMAFTNYLMQSIICTLYFNGYGLGNYNKLSYHQLYYVVGSVWIFQIIFSAVWLRYFQFGPFEWLWRSMTYWKKQPMRKVKPATVSVNAIS